MKNFKSLLIIISLALFTNKSYGQMVLGTHGDIEFSFQFMGENVDNLHCMSLGNAQYFIRVNNSFVNDTVKIIYN
ncbi:MAG: hypothetical protein ABI207_01325, partial [Crocinitomicaceae bacterium]